MECGLSITRPGENWYRCFSECPAGFYGVKCRRHCDCLNGAACDSRNGQCLCKPGYMGDRCESGMRFLFTNHWNVVSESCAHDPSYYSKLSIYPPDTPPDVHTKAWMCSSREFWKPLDFRLLVALVLSQSMELLAHLLCKDDFLLGYRYLIAICTSSEYLNIIDVCMWWAHANIACLQQSRWVFQLENCEGFQA